MRYFLTIFLLFSSLHASSATDSLGFKNDNIIVGEIKSMDRGVLQIEADYGENDFDIDWEEIQSISTSTSFFITISDGTKYYGTLRSVSGSRINIITLDKKAVEYDLLDIVNLTPIKKDFLDRLSASVDIGISLTKSNNLKQFTSRSTIRYRTQKWSTDATFNSLRSTQNNVEPIARDDVKIDYLYVHPGSWFSIVTVSLASNTEQKLDLRLNAQLGFGRFFIRTNSAYLGVNVGLNRNLESFSNQTADRKSWEGFLGTELNLYDIGDFSLLTKLVAYPGITESERFRADFTLDTKYDLPYDFYIKIGFTINYDNLPAEGASETDYVFLTGFGWEW